MRSAIVVFAVAIALVACSTRLSGQESEPPRTAGQFDLNRIGYVEPSEMARRSDAVNLSLDFLDRDHILFTFNPKKLFRRLPNCPATHNDRIIHASVIDISSGEIQEQADWYLHDAHRYLFNLGSGRVLLRKLNSLFVVDKDLHEKLIWTSPKDLLWVSVTPDGKQIITETEDTAASPAKAKQGSKRTFKIEFRDTDTLQLQQTIRSEKTANTESTSSGFASVIPGGVTGTVWLVRFGPNEKERVNIARVRTRRIPDVLYLSNNSLLIGRDSTRSPGYSVSAFTVTGNLLWRQHWDAHRYYPILAHSEDGSRFAIDTVRLVDTPASGSSLEGLEQRIDVYNTATGTPVMNTAVEPVVLQGQNFSLSPDGSRLAVLQGVSIEFYDLPVMTPEEQAKYTAMKADVPGLYIAPESGSSETQGTEPAFTSADSAPENAAEQAPALADSHGPSASTPSPLADIGHVDTRPVPSAPAASSPKASPLMTVKSRSQAVALDVVVTDSNGHTVKSVPRSDFLVREDGKPQAINYFDQVDAPASTVVGPESKQLAANVFTNVSPAPETAVTLILYDVLNTPSDGQQSAKLELLKFLQNKPKGTKFGFCVLSNTLRMVQGFTPDENLLIKAIKGQKGSVRNTSLKSQDAQDQQLVSWLSQSSQNTIARFGSRGAPMAASLENTASLIEEAEARRIGQDLNMRAWLTMDAFTQLARYLSAIPGRKSVIWISGSFPLGIFPGLELRNTDSTTTSYTERVKQAVNLLAESHIALYPVDVRGVTSDSILNQGLNLADSGGAPPSASQLNYDRNPEVRFRGLETLNALSDNGAALPGFGSPYMQEMSEHGIMDKIANDTGGRAFYNTNGIEQAMALALEEETNYYALSYTPTNKKYDGKFRRIKVSLAPGEKKLHVIHRSGYFAVDPDAADPLEKDAARGFGLAAMQHGSPQAHQVYFEARIVPVGKPRKAVLPVLSKPASAKKKKHQEPEAHPPEPVDVQRYVVDYVVTPNQVRFDTNPEGRHHGVINFMLTSFDGDETLRTSAVSQGTSNLDSDGFQEVLAGGLHLRQQVDVPVEAAWLRLGVQDALTGRLGTVEIPLPVKSLPGVEQSLGQKMPDIEPD